MKIFIDTNVFLDLLLDRPHSADAKKILSSVQSGIFDAYVADITLLNIGYIAKKQTTDIRKFLQYITDNFTILGAENGEFYNALACNNSDLEDNVQYFLANKVLCQVIISNDTSFPKANISVLTSTEFVKHHCL